jgi:uncharacterized protein YraI
MKHLFISVWLLVSAFVLNAQEVVTTANLNLRSAPSASASIVYQIAKGTAIELDGCQSSWCEVSYQGYTGYIAKQYTRSASGYNNNSAAHPTGEVKHYQNSKGHTVQSPTHYDKPPQGATAQCNDGTYSFSQSRRGTCSHHGGVKRWL